MEHSNLNKNSPADASTPTFSPQGYFTQQPQNTEGPKPIHLIYYNQEDKTYRVSEEAKEFLKGIKEKVGIISVAGKYRTGKSFLLNRVIINKKNQGFGVGPTINPCTKGLWIWGDTLEGEYQGEKLKILLIDSEGIGAFDEDENHDTKIFLFALLLCSYFIYNSMGTIDENAINNLSLIINLSKELQIKSDVLGEADPDEIAKYFPSFLWVVRDFSLRLLDNYGNSLTPKEYLESAIQPQKGTSDQVETKNRIRRLIKHFFKDRDCYTLVRPVEEEKQLQSLQSMPDELLRTEFVQSVNSLRSKIFKRVKPKTLNSKFITGEMLLELCQYSLFLTIFSSYTEAINTGSVPNIQNAWSYVCQNECQRAITDAIHSYDQHMRQILERAKIQCTSELIRSEHKATRDQAVATFKSKAVGQEIQEFEASLREGISKKYKDIKGDFQRYCKSRVQQQLDQQLSQIKKNLQNDQYETLDQFIQELDKVKSRYFEEGPLFPGKQEIFTETSMQLIVKAADFMQITSRKETDLNVKKLKERVEELDKEKLSIKTELLAEKRALESKIQELESDKNISIRNEKLLEERMKYLSEDKEKHEKGLNDKWKRKLDESQEQIKQLEAKVKTYENQLKIKDDEIFKRGSEFEKLNALIEQKLQLTENELNDYKQKYAAKDQDYKELNKELYNSRKEVQQLTTQLHRAEQDKQDTIKRMQQEHELALAEAQRQSNSMSNQSPQSGVSDAQQQEWNRERQQMQVQMKILTETLEAQKKMQETLITALTTQQQQQRPIENKASENKYKEKNKELLVTNQNLSAQIVQMQSKQQNLEKVISNLKQFKFMIHYAIAIQCKTCNKLYPKNHYSQHLPACNRENERMSTINAQQNIQPFEIIINSCLKKGNEYYYEMTIERNGQGWKLQKALSDFKTFFDELYAQFPTYSLPYIPDEWLANTQEEFFTTDLRKRLQVFLIDMVRVPFIRENSIFRQFLEIEQNYLDDDFEDPRGPRRTMQSMGGQIGSLSTTFSSQTNRNSVLNPFMSNTNNPGMILVNSNSKTMDGRKSVTPMTTNHIFSQQQENLFAAGGNSGQSRKQQYQQIQELVEDEDYSSMASNNRISMIMDDNMSSRPSVFSIKNQDVKVALPLDQHIFSSKTNSPFQPIGEGGGSAKSKERYSHLKETLPMSLTVEDQNDFEDSFNNDVSDLSISSKKITLNEDELAHRRFDENSPLVKEDFSKTKANLMKKFESEGSYQRRNTNSRYEEEEADELEAAGSGCEDDLQRE